MTDEATSRLARPNVNIRDHFAAFDLGTVHDLANPAAAEAFCAKFGLFQMCGDGGRHLSLA